MVETVINGRWNIKLPEHRAARPEWYTEEGWEKPRLEAMHDRIHPESNVIYIGAEVGEMPALCAMWGAHLIIAEPNERVHPTIREVFQANSLPMPYFYAGFCGRVSSPNSADGWCSTWPASSYEPMVTDHGFKELRDPGGRPILALDDIDKAGVNIQFRWPDIISMDVEGSEWEVLQGAERMLRQHHPILFVSLHPEFLIDQYGKYSYEVRRWLRDEIGYRETLLQYEHEAHFMYEPK